MNANNEQATPEQIIGIASRMRADLVAEMAAWQSKVAALPTPWTDGLRARIGEDALAFSERAGQFANLVSLVADHRIQRLGENRASLAEAENRLSQLPPTASTVRDWEIANRTADVMLRNYELESARIDNAWQPLPPSPQQLQPSMADLAKKLAVPLGR